MKIAALILAKMFLYHHGTLIRTGMNVRKSFAICATQLADGVLLKIQKYFEAKVKHVGNLPRLRNIESRLVNTNMFSSISQSYFFIERIKYSSCRLLL